MSQSTKGFSKTLTSAADLSAKTGYIVKLDTSGNLVVATAGTDTTIVGVLDDAPNAGGSGTGCTYQFLGTAKVVLGGTVAIGDWLTSTTGGVAITTTTDGNRTIGMALEAGVTGDIIEVQLALGWFHNG